MYVCMYVCRPRLPEGSLSWTALDVFLLDCLGMRKYVVYDFTCIVPLYQRGSNYLHVFSLLALGSRALMTHHRGGGDSLVLRRPFNVHDMRGTAERKHKAFILMFSKTRRGCPRKVIVVISHLFVCLSASLSVRKAWATYFEHFDRRVMGFCTIQSAQNK